MKRDPRPKQYRYWDQLMAHVKDSGVFFNGRLVYPRQFEIHLPGNHLKPCDLACPHCAGKLFQKDLGTWEMDALELLDKLKGKIPFHIYGGAYTEPLINPYYMTFLHMTKKHGNHFGIHTNGTLLLKLEEQQGWLTELNRISTDDVDYLSVSLDAGHPSSWGQTKGTKDVDLFDEILDGLEKAVEIREKRGKGHAIRLCYLISPRSDSMSDFESIISKAKSIGVDSLRFSIPFDCYNQSFDEVRKYKEKREVPMNKVYKERLKPFLSKSKTERPYIFYTGPEFTDIDKFNFKQCLYPYYQITYGADGYAYRCSTTATPTAKHCRLGKITSDLGEFKKMLLKNADPNWSPDEMCFKKGLRGNRMAMEINCRYQALKKT